MADTSEPPIKSGFLSSEFTALAVKVISSIVMLFVILGRITPDESDAALAVVGALAAMLGANAWAVGAYIKARTALKVETIAALGPAKASAVEMTVKAVGSDK